MADLSPGARTSPSQQSFSRSTRKVRPKARSPARTKPSQSNPGSAVSTFARSGPRANWNTKRRRSEKNTRALRLSCSAARSARPSTPRSTRDARSDSRGDPRTQGEVVIESVQVIVAEFDSGPVEREATASENGDPIGYPESRVEAVGGDHEGAAARLERHEKLAEPVPARAIEPRERLIEEEEPATSEEDAGERESPLHARRERARAALRHRVELH